VPERDVRSIEVRGPDPSRELAPRPAMGSSARRLEGRARPRNPPLRPDRRQPDRGAEGQRSEVLEMLERTKRQHGLARQRPLDHAVRRLYGASDKPP